VIDRFVNATAEMKVDQFAVSAHMFMRRFRPSLAFMALSILCLSCGSPDQESKVPLKSKVMVSAESGLVTLDVTHAPLAAVLAAIGQQAQITIHVPDNISSERISLSFQNLLLEEALKRMLTGQSYTFLYKQDKGREVIAGIRLFAKHEQAPPTNPTSSNGMSAMAQLMGNQSLAAMTRSWGRGGSRMSEEIVALISDDVPLDELKRSFSETKDSARRSAILDAMANRGEEGPVGSALSMALSDSDEEVRTDALNHLKMTSETLPLGPLAQMATTDSNSDLRMEAMTLMADQLSAEERTKEEWAMVQASLSRSLSDPNQDVREQAEVLLSELH
jgi:hypothetical protein